MLLVFEYAGKERLSNQDIAQVMGSSYVKMTNMTQRVVCAIYSLSHGGKAKHANTVRVMYFPGMTAADVGAIEMTMNMKYTGFNVLACMEEDDAATFVKAYKEVLAESWAAYLDRLKADIAKSIDEDLDVTYSRTGTVITIAVPGGVPSEDGVKPTNAEIMEMLKGRVTVSVVKTETTQVIKSS